MCEGHAWPDAKTSAPQRGRERAPQNVPPATEKDQRPPAWHPLDRWPC
jgi:hypothetical protein